MPGLVGANGAGKSTLMNVLGGVIRADEALSEIDNSRVEIDSPLAAALRVSPSSIRSCADAIYERGRERLPHQLRYKSWSVDFKVLDLVAKALWRDLGC